MLIPCLKLMTDQIVVSTCAFCSLVRNTGSKTCHQNHVGTLELMLEASAKICGVMFLLGSSQIHMVFIIFYNLEVIAEALLAGYCIDETRDCESLVYSLRYRYLMLKTKNMKIWSTKLLWSSVLTPQISGRSETGDGS